MPVDPNCPSCAAEEMHTAETWKLHPGEGRGGFHNAAGQPVKPAVGAQDAPAAPTPVKAPAPVPRSMEEL